MAARPSQDAWAAARVKWESNPTESYESVGKALGVSKQAVAARAKKDGWERAPVLREVVERAHFKADKREIDAKVDGQVDAGTAKGPSAASASAAEDLRADVIERHRADWSEHRRLFTLQEIKDNFEQGKVAKISAEMLMLRQKGERAAYGLDAVDGPGPMDGGRELSDIERAARVASIIDRARRRAAEAAGE